MKQIFDGEDKGIHAYEDRISDLDPESRDMVRAIMQEDHDHLKYFQSRFERKRLKTLVHKIETFWYNKYEHTLEQPEMEGVRLWQTYLC
jgi:predicted thioredoxin/glutaredoxin